MEGITGKFGVIYSDPAWQFVARGKNGNKRSQEAHYKTMTLDEIKALPVADVAAKDCFLFMWTTGPHLKQAFAVIDAWGFKYSGMGFTWIKLKKSAPTLFLTRADLHIGMGYTTRKNAEFCLLARRGRPKRLRKDIQEVIISARREHSRKPDEVYDRIEQFASGPYLEMFARTERKGWKSWGNETKKFVDD